MEDNILELVSDEETREILKTMESYDSDVFERDKLVQDLHESGYGEREENLEARLSHSLLPRLNDTGIVDYDSRWGDIKYHGREKMSRFLNLSAEESLETLSDRKTRNVLYSLKDTDGEVVQGELAEELAGSEPFQEPVSKIEIDLRHNYLPRLDDKGLVEYDPENRTVQPSYSEDVEELLDMVDECAGHNNLGCF